MTVSFFKPAFAALAFAGLAGCVAPYPAVAPVVVDPVPAPVVAQPVTVTGVAGLQSREPDGCHAANYRSAVGQPASVIRTLGISREYRVAEYRGIEPEEYDALRVVFNLDAAGNIQSVTCG